MEVKYMKFMSSWIESCWSLNFLQAFFFAYVQLKLKREIVKFTCSYISLLLQIFSLVIAVLENAYRKKHEETYLSLRMVCSSWTWSFTLIIFNCGPNSCLGTCCGGFSSGVKPFANRPFSEATLHFSPDLDVFLFPRVSFSSLDLTSSGILCNTALIHA